MGVAAERLRRSAEDVLARDATQTVRHEFVTGEVFAMAGVAEAHVTVALDVAMALRQHVAGSPCRTFISDMKLRVEAADAHLYPEVAASATAA